MAIARTLDNSVDRCRLRRFLSFRFADFSAKSLMLCARAACLVAILAVGADSARAQIIKRDLVQTIGKDNTTKKYMLAAAPTVVLAAIGGGSGGYAYHHVSVNVDQGSSTVGSGEWKSCKVSWTLTVGGATPSTRITCYDPINCKTRYLDRDQHGMNFNCLVIDTGAVSISCTVTNDTGLSTTQTISCGTVAARDTSKYVYVDGARADNTGDGLSWATAKRDYDAGYALALTKGNGATLWWRTCNMTANSAAVTITDFAIIAENSSQICTATGNFRMALAGSSTNGLVVYGGKFTASSGTNGFIVVGTDAVTQTNICVCNIRHGAINCTVQISGDGDVDGLSMINITEDGACDQQELFTNNTHGFLGWGLITPTGCTVEHSYRFGGGGEVGLDSSYHSFEYSILSNNVSTGKSPLRWYGSSNLWCHGCDIRRKCLIGFVSPGGSATGGSNWCFDRCIFSQDHRFTTERSVVVYSAWTNGVFRCCHFKGVSLLFNPRDTETASHFVDKIDIINNTFRPERSTQAIRWSTSLTNVPTNCRVIANQFIGSDVYTTTQAYVEMKGNTGVTFQYNNFDRTSATHTVMLRQDGSTQYNFTTYSALSFVSNETRNTTTANILSCKPTAGLTNVASGTYGPWYDYWTGDDWVRSSAYEAGAWQSPTSETQETFSSNGTWTCPAGVSSIRVYAWGGGGGGGSRSNTGNGSAGGGGGGEASYGTLTVTAGQNYSYTRGGGGGVTSGDITGTAGSDTTFNGDGGTSIVAKGGSGGVGGASGAGGAAGTGGTGTLKGAGGSGGAGSGVGVGGGSGGSGGSFFAVGVNGTTGTASTGGLLAATGPGGQSGAGGFNAAGSVGLQPGGGGGGGSSDASGAILGGVGGPGFLMIAYTVGAASSSRGTGGVSMMKMLGMM